VARPARIDSGWRYLRDLGIKAPLEFSAGADTYGMFTAAKDDGKLRKCEYTSITRVGEIKTGGDTTGKRGVTPSSVLLAPLLLSRPA
jgi:hypothetical protein